MHLSVNFSTSTLYYILVLFVFTGCGTSSGPSVSLDIDGTFSGPMLSQHEIFELHNNEQIVYAGTSDNLYQNQLTGDNWQPLGLVAGQVRTFVVFSEQELLASVFFTDLDSATIAKTTDGGQTWMSFRNGYSRGKNSRIPSAIERSPANPNRLFAGGPGGLDIALSHNGGTSWELVFGSWENLGFLEFLKIDTNRNDYIWSGGANGIFEPILAKSTDGGENWQLIDILKNVETTVYDVAIDPSSSNRVLAGLGRGIRKSTDGGESWRTVFERAGIYTFTHSASNPEVIYAAGQTQESTLSFFATGDFGDTWQTVEMQEGPAGITVNDMVSVMADGMEVLYLGTNQGVYSYTFEE